MRTKKQSDRRETAKRQLVRILDEDTIDLHLVSAEQHTVQHGECNSYDTQVKSTTCNTDRR